MQKWNTYSILFEHKDWVAVNKPSGMASIPERNEKAPTILQTIEKALHQKCWVVHRLDKETSGVLLFAKNEVAHKRLSLGFQERNIQKTYWGLTAGALYPKSGTIDAPIAQTAQGNLMKTSPKGKPAITQYDTLQELGLISLVEFKPITGRTHQLRVHCKHIGHPLLCDSLYGNGMPVFLSQYKKGFHKSPLQEELPILSRLALHSKHIGFTYEGEAFSIEAPLFKDMGALINQLSKLS